MAVAMMGGTSCRFLHNRATSPLGEQCWLAMPLVHQAPFCCAVFVTIGRASSSASSAGACHATGTPSSLLLRCILQDRAPMTMTMTMAPTAMTMTNSDKANGNANDDEDDEATYELQVTMPR